MPARSRDRPPGPRAGRRGLWVRPASGLVWSMNCDSWLVPKNSLMEATTGRMLIRVCGVIASPSWVVIRSRAARSLRGGQATVAEVVDVVDAVVRLAGVQPDDVLDGGDDVVLGERGRALRHVHTELLEIGRAWC